MSTEIAPNLARRLRPVGVAAWLAVLAAGEAAWAAPVGFTPILNLRAYRDGNPTVTGEGNTSDEVLQVALDLSWSVKMPRTTVNFGYRPDREIHRKLDHLDATNHSVGFDVSRSLSRRATFAIGLSGSSTRRQGVDPNRPEEPITFVPRTRIRSATLRAFGRVQSGQRAFWTWQAGGGVNRRQDLASLALEDSELAEVGVGWGFETGEERALQVNYRFQRIWYETIESASVHTVDFKGSRDLGNLFDGSLALGVSRAQSVEGRVTEPFVDGVLTRFVGEVSTLSVGARQLISSGNGIRGATRDRGAYTAWRRLGRKRKAPAVDLHGGYWRRDDLRLGGAGESTSALQVSEAVSWDVGGRLALGVFHSYTDQRAVGGSDPRLGASYHSGGFSLRWNILGAPDATIVAPPPIRP